MRTMSDRYAQPFIDLFDNWLWKAIAGLTASLFATPIAMPAILLGLFLLDIWSGIRRSKSQGQKITASKLSKATVKATDYMIFIISTTLFSKMHHTLDFAQVVAYVFVAITYLKSIAENITGIKGNDSHPVTIFMRKLEAMNPFGFFDSDNDGETR